MYHSTLGLRVIKKNEKKGGGADPGGEAFALAGAVVRTPLRQAVQLHRPASTVLVAVSPRCTEGLAGERKHQALNLRATRGSLQATRALLIKQFFGHHCARQSSSIVLRLGFKVEVLGFRF